MEKYKSKLGKRLVLLIVIFVVTLLTSLFLLTVVTDIDTSEFIRGFKDGFRVGICVFLLAVTAINAIKTGMALKNENKLKEMYIKETDERYKLMLMKVGSTGINICLFTLWFATMVSAYFNNTVFFTLLCVTFFVSLVKMSLKIYYMNKF